ncbi:MAG TPA: decaprenyl-phosphate phosphoribosyltransferase [Mycobacteriales bacterium]|jgi:decaprenyl-phosphate phosphoribosyltransferase|nr:decaprenyl-phosphate phosphoribosyltransferase [Mycobacteriales bacterium]
MSVTARDRAAQASSARPSLVRGLVKEARPKQWAKNSLLFAAPGAAGVLTEGRALLDVLLGVLAFCFVASGVYYLNDVKDVEADRVHPTKRTRPVAAGIVPVRLAVVVGVGLFVAGAVVAALVDWRLLVVLLIYVVTTTAYSLHLKHVPVIDLVIVASGFLLRAIAGGVAADVPLSPLFLLVAAFGSLFMVAGKRHGEFMEMGEERASTRSSLALYSDAYLRYVWSIASAVTMVGYSLWAFQLSELAQPIWYELSVGPFVVALLRYAYLVEGGQGGEPEELVLGDRQLQLYGLLWVLLFAAGVYLS